MPGPVPRPAEPAPRPAEPAPRPAGLAPRLPNPHLAPPEQTLGMSRWTLPEPCRVASPSEGQAIGHRLQPCRPHHVSAANPGTLACSVGTGARARQSAWPHRPRIHGEEPGEPGCRPTLIGNHSHLAHSHPAHSHPAHSTRPQPFRLPRPLPVLDRVPEPIQPLKIRSRHRKATLTGKALHLQKASLELGRRACERGDRVDPASRATFTTAKSRSPSSSSSRLPPAPAPITASTSRVSSRTLSSAPVVSGQSKPIRLARYCAVKAATKASAASRSAFRSDNTDSISAK